MTECFPETMRVWPTLLLALLLFGALPLSAVEVAGPTGMYVCRSPLLAFDFWGSVIHVSQELRIRLTRQIMAQLAADQKCVPVVSERLRPIKSSWGGALAVADGDKSPIFFHNPDTLGWVHPDYYVQYVNEQHRKPTDQDPRSNARK